MLIGTDKKSRALAVVALVVISGAGWSVVQTWLNRRALPVDIRKAGTSVVLAEQTAKLLSQRGRVVLIHRDPQLAPVAQADVDNFRRHLAPAVGVIVAGTVWVGPEALTGVPADAYLDAITKHGDVDAIVSFVGLPELNDTDLARVPKNPPRLVALALGRTEAVSLFQAGILHVLVLPRVPLPATDPRRLKTAQELFDYFYEIVVPETAGATPAPAP